MDPLGSPLPWWLSAKESTCQAGDMGSIPELGRSPGEGNGNPLQYSCLGKSHGQKSLVVYSPWGCFDSKRVENDLAINNNWDLHHSLTATGSSLPCRVTLGSAPELTWRRGWRAAPCSTSGEILQSSRQAAGLQDPPALPRPAAHKGLRDRGGPGRWGGESSGCQTQEVRSPPSYILLLLLYRK